MVTFAQSPSPFTSPAAASAAFELPRVWPSTAFLPGADQPGPGWRIGPTVSNDGIYNTWSVSSAIGPFEITGNERLIELLREIEATIRLQELSKSREFAQGLADAGRARLDSVVQVAKDPVETVRRLPQGASRFLGRVGGTINNAMHGSLDIDRSATPEETARRLMGIERAKRLIAAELGVNPYSHNQILQRALNDVATVRALGTVTISVGSMIVVPATIGYAMTGVTVTSSLTREQVAAEPRELAAANRARALAAGLPAASIDALNANPHYDPWTLTALWNSIAEIGPVNSVVFVDMAAAASSDLDAFFFLRNIQIIAMLQSRGARIREFIALPFTVACVMGDGAIVLPLWLDYAIWTPQAEAAAQELLAIAKARNAPMVTVVTTGDFSPAAIGRLSALGIQTRTRILMQATP